MRFENKFTQPKTAINMILANVSLAGKLTSGGMSFSINDFKILQSFKVLQSHVKLQSLSQSLGTLLNATGLNVIVMMLVSKKKNSYDAARGAPGQASCGGYTEITVQLLWDVLLKIMVFPLLYMLN